MGHAFWLAVCTMIGTVIGHIEYGTPVQGAAWGFGFGALVSLLVLGGIGAVIETLVDVAGDVLEAIFD